MYHRPQFTQKGIECGVSPHFKRTSLASVSTPWATNLLSGVCKPSAPRLCGLLSQIPPVFLDLPVPPPRIIGLPSPGTCAACMDLLWGHSTTLASISLLPAPVSPTLLPARSSHRDLFKMPRASSARTSHAPHCSLGHGPTPKAGIQSPLWFGCSHIPSGGPGPRSLSPQPYSPECALLPPVSCALSPLLTSLLLGPEVLS